MTWRHRLGFLLLCLLGSSVWLVEEAWPSPMPTASRQCLHYLVIALVSGLFRRRSIGHKDHRTRILAKIAAASVALFGIPAVLIVHAETGVSQATITALFALLPVIVVLFVPYSDLGKGFASGETRLLGPALIGLTGALFLLPFALPTTFRETSLYAVVVIAVLSAAYASVWMYRLLSEIGVFEAVITCCVANVMFLLVNALVSNAIDGTSWAAVWSWNAVGVETLKAVCVDMPQIVLLLWLMREVAPERLATRVLVIPLITVLEGYAMIRPVLSLRSIGGAMLLIYGAWKLLTSKEREQEPQLMLR